VRGSVGVGNKVLKRRWSCRIDARRIRIIRKWQAGLAMTRLDHHLRHIDRRFRMFVVERARAESQHRRRSK
jgi:hypothetical protein